MTQRTWFTNQELSLDGVLHTIATRHSSTQWIIMKQNM